MSNIGAIGIDLGTTFSCVGVYKNGRVDIIANTESSRITPSVVAFTDKDRLVGEAAKMQAGRNPLNTVFAAKRLMGRRFDDPILQQDMKLLPYKIVENDEEPVIEVKYKGESKQKCPEEISAYVLQKMKNTADKYIGKNVERAVITVPAYFNDGQRQSTKDAAEIAGFKEVKMINEPTAAAIAYGLENVKEGSKTVLIFDLGGGTFDVTIVKIGKNLKFDVLATAGDTHLGGDDFDRILLKHFANEFEQEFGGKIENNPKALSKLRSACEKAKIHLSNYTEANIEIDALLNGEDFTSRITRAKFDDLCDDLFQKTIETVKNALNDAGLNASAIDDIVLVGGSTRILKIQDLLKEFFKNKVLKHSVNPDEAVAYGAAIYAAKSFGAQDTTIKEFRLSDVTPLSLGIKTKGNVQSTIIKRNTTIPTTATGDYYTTEDNQTNIDINIYEGERLKSTENHHLGHFKISGIPPLPSGEGKIKVTMVVDSNGILTVSAVVVSNGNSESLRIANNKGRLTKDEIEKMIEEAKKFEIGDREHKEQADARNELENYAFSVRNALAKNQKRLNADEIKVASKAWKEAIDWIETNKSAKKEAIKNRYNNLKNTCSPMMSKMQ